jgi:predicted transcriptional regulator
MAAEMSAFFIKKNVANMINISKNGAFLYEKMIEDITLSIDNDYKKVRDLIREIEE